MTFHLYFNGLEVPSHRKVLTEAGIEHAGLSYWGLVRGKRIPKTKPYTVSDVAICSEGRAHPATGSNIAKAHKSRPPIAPTSCTVRPFDLSLTIMLLQANRGGSIPATAARISEHEQAHLILS